MWAGAYNAVIENIKEQIVLLTDELSVNDFIGRVFLSDFGHIGNSKEVAKNMMAKGEKKKTYIVTAESPTAAETFISDYLEVNVECTFEAVKISKLNYDKVIKLYETEREEYESSGKTIYTLV